jgi:steroid delta-isomerase-like uncharacterized protein
MCPLDHANRMKPVRTRFRSCRHDDARTSCLGVGSCLEWAAAFNRHDIAGTAALYHDDSINIQMLIGKPVPGRDSTISACAGLFRAFPDVRVEVEHLFEDGEWAILEWTLRGTHHGEFAGHPPSGRAFTLRGAEFFQAVGGRIRFQRATGIRRPDSISLRCLSIESRRTVRFRDDASRPALTADCGQQ